MKSRMLTLAAIATVGLTASSSLAATVIVSSFAANTSTAGVWGVTDIESGGTASIVAAAPSGGPLGPGAALITTNSGNPSKAEVGVSNNFGTGSILNTINLAYSFYKQNGGADAAAAPSIKLTFFDASYSGDGFVTLIYEPYYNMTGNPADNTWYTANIDATHGEFWENGGFGQPNQAGGAFATNNTLSGWLAAFDSTSGNAFSTGAELVACTSWYGHIQPQHHRLFRFGFHQRHRAGRHNL